MTPESQVLRQLIRNDQMACYCDVVTRLVLGEHGHEPGCQWAGAVKKIYELERAQETQT